MHRLVVHCKLEEYDIYIGRPGIWGNPFFIGKDGTREEIIEKFREMILSDPEIIAGCPALHGLTHDDVMDGGFRLAGVIK